eukprot:254262_1
MAFLQQQSLSISGHEISLNEFQKGNNSKQQCNVTNNTQLDIKQCDHIFRLATTLRYYTLLVEDENDSTNDIFLSYCNDIYTQLLDDWTHFITKHSSSTQSLSQSLIESKYFKKCNVENCRLTTRHYVSKYVHNNIENNQKELSFYIEIMDQLHLHLFHLFELGLRSNKTQNKPNKKKSKKDKVDYKCIDNELTTIIDNISDKRKKYDACIDRFNNENNKFNLIQII